MEGVRKMSRANTREITVDTLHMLADDIETAISLMTKQNGKGGCNTQAVRKLLDVCDYLRGQSSSGSSISKNSSAALGSS